ncbi:MAG: hypothetical protein GY711_01045 [bacterium]|nr:hypothetical protein [bacterium]
MGRPLALALLLLACTAAGCQGTRKLSDPTVRITTENGRELGVSTNYGVVFLGRTARSGYIEIEAYYGDGPSIESTVIEPVGDGLYTAETEIRLPVVPLTFIDPRAGESLIIAGRNDSGPWEVTARVRKDPRVRGLLLDFPSRLEGRPDQVGAGVYLVDPEDEFERRLVGLVAGRVRLEGESGSEEYLAVHGPESLWRIVAHRRDLLKRKPPVYREDVR